MMSERWRCVTLLGVLLVGTGLRVAWVGRPLDHRLANPWREADYAQIARNFHREDGSLLYPRIDWRRDTPGYVESEFPLLPWLAAQLYRVFGYDIVLFRVLSVSLGVAALLLFALIAHRMLEPPGALFAVTAFALNPYLVRMGNALQPEPLMILLILLAVALIWRWSETPSWTRLFAASAAAAGAMLAKMPSAYLGLIFAYTVLRRCGPAALRDVRLYLAAALALGPPLAWSLWARRFWVEYGNSLGVSNETHLITWSALFPPAFLLGNLTWETLGVWTPSGWLLGLAALRLPRARIEPFLVWYGAVWCFYILAANTSGDRWANYYHSASVAPAALLMGAGLTAGLRGLVLSGKPVSLAARQRVLTGLIAGVTIVLLAATTALVIHRRDTKPATMYHCALQFANHVPPKSTIVVSGGPGRDELGQPVATDEPMFFAWMDRRGFTYALEDLSLATLTEIRARGGHHWIARQWELEHGEIPRLSSRWPVVARCDGYALLRMDDVR